MSRLENKIKKVLFLLMDQERKTPTINESAAILEVAAIVEEYMKKAYKWGLHEYKSATTNEWARKPIKSLQKYIDENEIKI